MGQRYYNIFSNKTAFKRPRTFFVGYHNANEC